MMTSIIKPAKMIAAFAVCISMAMSFPAGAAMISEDAPETAESSNLLVNPEWETGTDGWEITALNEYGELEDSIMLHTVISQDVPLENLLDQDALMLKLSGSIAVAPEDPTQKCIGLELAFYNADAVMISPSESGESLVEYEYGSALTYHEVLLEIPEGAQYARVSLGIWKDSEQNPMYFENLCLETVQKSADSPFYRSAGKEEDNSFRKSSGTDGSEVPAEPETGSEDLPEQDPGKSEESDSEQDFGKSEESDPEQDPGDGSEPDSEWDPQVIEAYEEWAQEALNTYEGPYASDLPAFQEPENVSVPEDGRAEASSGVVVDFSDSLDIGENPVLSISETPAVTDGELGATYKAYDITLGEVHELDGYIEIRLPYDGSNIESGQDPAKCVAGMYLNEETGQWEPVIYDVDVESQELIICTDHLSQYGCFEFVNEGRRCARVTSINDYMMTDDPLQCAAAIKEIMDSKGVPGVECRKVAQPYLESFLRSYYESSVSNTADLATKVGNISGMLITVTPGVEAAINKSPLAYGLNQALGKAGLAISVISLATQMAKEDKTDNEILSMYKDAMYLLATVSGESILGTIGASVWVIDYAITDMGNYVYNKVKENLSKAYRFYMTTDNKWHGKPRTLKEWRRILKKAAKTAMKENSDAQNAIMNEIDEYCGAFWRMRDDDLAEVYDEVGLGGRGLPDAATKDAITNEFKGELMDSLQGVIRAVQNDLNNELLDEKEKRLEEVRKILNTVISIEIREKTAEGNSGGDDPKAQYAGYTAAFAPLDQTAVPEDWRLTLGSDGNADTKMTYIAWLLAGQPNEIQLYHPGQKVGEDKPEKTVSFKLEVPKTVVKIGTGNIEAYLGKWRYVTEDTIEVSGEVLKQITTETVEFILDGDTLTVCYYTPVTTNPSLGDMIQMTLGKDITLMGTYSIDEKTGDLLHHIHSASKGDETQNVEHMMIYRLADENHLLMKNEGNTEFEPEAFERAKK